MVSGEDDRECSEEHRTVRHRLNAPKSEQDWKRPRYFVRNTHIWRFRRDNTEDRLCLAYVGADFERHLRGVEALGEMLRSPQCGLRHLRLQGNALRCDGAAFVVAGLASNKTLRSLSMRHNRVGVEGCRACANALRTNATLESLDLANNETTGATRPRDPSGLVALADALKTRNRTLRVLDVDGSGVDDARHATNLEPAALAFATCLQQNDRLERINL